MKTHLTVQMSIGVSFVLSLPSSEYYHRPFFLSNFIASQKGRKRKKERKREEKKRWNKSPSMNENERIQVRTRRKCILSDVMFNDAHKQEYHVQYLQENREDNWRSNCIERKSSKPVHYTCWLCISTIARNFLDQWFILSSTKGKVLTDHRSIQHRT